MSERLNNFSTRICILCNVKSAQKKVQSRHRTGLISYILSTIIWGARGPFLMNIGPDHVQVNCS